MAQVVMGQSPPGSSYNEVGDGLPFIQGAAEFGPEVPAPVKWCNDPRKVAVAGDLLFSVRAPVGRQNFSGSELAVGRGLAIIRGSEVISTRFLALALEFELPQVLAASGTGMFQSITGERLRNITIPLPTSAEQRRIVDLLDAARTLELAAARHARSLTGLASALRAEAMGVAADYAPLSQAAEVTMGRQRSPKHAEGEHMVPYMRAANVKDGRLDLSDVLQMNFTPSEQTKYALEVGDVLVSEGCGSLAQIGASARWNAEISAIVCFQNTLLRLRARQDVTDPDYLYQWARWAFESGAFARVASGTNIFHIGATRATDMPFPMRPLDEQREIAARLEDCELAVSRSAEKQQTIAQLRHSLLSGVLSGTLELDGSHYDQTAPGLVAA